MTTTEEAGRRGTTPVAGVVVLVVGLMLMAGLSWRAGGQLTDPVTFVGTGRRGADQQAPRAFVLTAIPLLTLVIAAVLLAAQRLRRSASSGLRVPLWRDDRTHRRAVDLALGTLVPVLLGLHLLMLRVAEGGAESGLGYVAAAVALLTVIVGNVWPKQVLAAPESARVKLDHRLDHILEAQRRNLRPVGIAMMVLGLVALACSWLAPLVSLGMSLLAVLVLGGAILTTTWRSATSVR